MERDSILFYRSFYDAIRGLPKDIQLEIYTTIMEYGLNGELPENPKPVTKGMFALMRPLIDSNNVRFENGKKGGRKSSAAKKSAPQPAVYALSFDQEVEQMKADTEWSDSVCKDYGLSQSEYAEHLSRFLEHCIKNRNGKLHDSFDDAKSHLRYWMDKGGRRSKKLIPNNHTDNIPPDYGYDGGFGGQDI